jgi:hypothetical protein
LSVPQFIAVAIKRRYKALMTNGSALADIANTIQAAIAPVFLLAGISGILGVISTRLGRAIDRTRVLETLYHSTSGADHARHVNELQLLDRRITYANSATTLCVASALAVCLLIILLFVGQLTGERFANSVAALFVVAVLLLAGGLMSFLLEIRIAIRALRVRAELLKHRQDS